jgi:hypothetical protein
VLNIRIITQFFPIVKLKIKKRNSFYENLAYRP